MSANSGLFGLPHGRPVASPYRVPFMLCQEKITIVTSLKRNAALYTESWGFPRISVTGTDLLCVNL